jgi:TolB-like protein
MHHHLRLLAFFALCLPQFGLAQELDKQLLEMAEKIGEKLKSESKTKVAVIDFTDLQGNPVGELGKYIAEELTVNLVNVKRGYSVLDRANLRKILAEHKLTSTGVIDPENAKKIGRFAGLDALVLGTMLTKGTNIALTAKLISIETAEIFGAVRAEVKSDSSVEQLAAKPPVTNDATGSAQPKPFGDLVARLQSFEFIPDNERYGYAHLTLVITNTSETKTWGVALHPDHYNYFHLRNSRGEDFKATELEGVEKAFESFGRYQGSLTDVPPRTTITITSKSQVAWNGTPGDFRPYRLNTVAIYGEAAQGRHINLKKHNVVLEHK